MDYKDNLEIDLIDLAKSIWGKWKILVACAVIGAVIAGGYGYFKSGVVVTTNTGEVVVEAEESIESLREKLTDESAELVELAAGQYDKYIGKYRDYVEYGKTSIVMQLDANKAAKLSKLYAIDDYSIGFKQNEETKTENSADVSSLGELFISDADNIISVYAKDLTNDEIIKSIKGTLGLDADNSYIKELVSIGSDGNSILSISCYGADKEYCRKIMDVLDENLDIVTEKIQTVYDYDIKYIDEYYSEGPEKYIQDIQNSNATNMNTMRNSIISLSSAMSPDEKAYYNALIALGDSSDSDILLVSEKDNNAVEGEQASVDSVVVKKAINKKYVFLGLVGGLFLAAFYFALRYIISGKLHTADDLRSAFGLSVIGEVSGDDDLGLVSKGAELAASKLLSNNVYIMGASDDDVAIKVRNSICKKIIDNHGVSNVKAGSSAVNDAVSMQGLSDSDSVVLVERVDKSGYDDIAKEIELCKKFGVKILGAVVVK